ncbi:hypothetical protein Cgig2_028952 [Carnegiea gigantea]|uniref:Uncharacterized protein n=1 Tax=Carnegiea gigantea TaxID=171969 RepID=A0A9Q1JVA5_9CARY|nr:hypothetical protein Cgig2_028952 [Carnegiea gigantea]
MWVGTTQLKFPGIVTTKRCPPRSSSFRIRCCDSNSSTPRGFDPSDDSNGKKRSISKQQKRTVLQQSDLGTRISTSTSRQPTSMSGQAPLVSSRSDKKYRLTASDVEFEERLQAVRRSALEKKKAEEEREFGAIDYDAPVESQQSTIGLGTKIGVGIAVVVFGLVFAFGDFLPTGSITSSEDDGAVRKKLSKEETAALRVSQVGVITYGFPQEREFGKAEGDKVNVGLEGTLKIESKWPVHLFSNKGLSRLQQYEATLTTSPKDPVALEGAAVTLAELGEYTRAATLLEDLAKEKPNDPDVFRLLGEVKYELKDYEASAAAYKSSAKVSQTRDFEVLRGLTNALLAANKPDEAVQVLLESRERLNKEKESQNVDPIQVDLLLGKAYSDWGHISDAVSVYDQLISSHPNDFRGYLAKGILLKQNGNVGDAERMFIQARFFAPDKAKALVDRYAKS